MAKYELIEKTELKGDIWYHIKKDGRHVDDSYTRDLETAQKMYDYLITGGRTEPIIKVLNSIEVNENETN